MLLLQIFSSFSILMIMVHSYTRYPFVSPFIHLFQKQKNTVGCISVCSKKIKNKSFCVGWFFSFLLSLFFVFQFFKKSFYFSCCYVSLLHIIELNEWFLFRFYFVVTHWAVLGLLRGHTGVHGPSLDRPHLRLLRGERKNAQPQRLVTHQYNHQLPG